ncbi:MAG: glycosyltransferase family 2 protein [Paracoccaceae bacterium]
MASWSTVTTAKENPAQLRAFVAWHLGAGAQEIVIFFDDPADPSAQIFAHMPQVTTYLCDQTHWDSFDMPRPSGIRKRQILNTKVAYSRAKTDWLVHIDIDELIYPSAPVSQILAAIPASHIALRMRPMERLFRAQDLDQPYTEYFRHMDGENAPEWLARIYRHPEQMPHGFFGHTGGKIFVRTGQNGLTLYPHNMLINDQPAELPEVSAMHLLHLYSFGHAHFIDKGRWKFARLDWRRKQDESAAKLGKSARRRKNIAEVFERNDMDKQTEMFRDAFVFDHRRLRSLRKYQTVQRYAFTKTLDGRLARYFGATS